MQAHYGDKSGHHRRWINRLQTCASVSMLTSWRFTIFFLIGYFTIPLQASQVRAERSEVVCTSRDIRNKVEKFNDLRNCTVIEGSLQILLIDYADPSQYDDLSFPNLTEITDYLLLYRVYGLRSLSHIFPNLAVIRGRKLFYNYALVAFEMPDLEDLGLGSLVKMQRGAIRLEKNPKLCYIDTIDWTNITEPSIRMEDNFIMENKKPDECVNVCPADEDATPICKVKTIQYEGGKRKQPLCWNSQKCQKICPERCGKDGSCYFDRNMNLQCCDPQCLGGCTGPGPGRCIACKNVFSKGYCKEYCTQTTYKFWDRRCITEDQCRKMAKRLQQHDRGEQWKMHGGECMAECPSNFMGDPRDDNKCKPCEGTCPKVCGSALVDSVASAQAVRGCTVIEGFLEIQIRGGNRVGQELEENLGQIQMVTGAVKILSSEAIVSLNFLRNLTVIQGQSLLNDRYALFVLDNQNLQDIWDFKTHPNLTILRGTIFFHQNHKLCLHKIQELVKHVGLEDKVDDVDISKLNNGDQVACNITTLKLEVRSISSLFAIVQWTNFRTNDQRMLLNYVIYYREAPEQNITIFNARDACGTDIWRTSDVRPLNDPGEDEKYVSELIYDLTPWTQYAMYVQTYTISASDRGAMSPIVYFRTQPAAPTHPREVKVKALKGDELLVTWKAPSKPNGNVTHYYVYWQPQPLSREKLDQRDYCRDKLHLSHLKKDGEDDQKKPNETMYGENCCACPQSEEEERQAEEERMFQIEFENFLHNTVYVKRPVLGEDDGPDGGPNRRRRRDVRRRVYRQTDLNNIGSSINSSYLNILNEMKTKHNMTVTNDTEEADVDHMPYNAAVVYHKLEFILSNLKHFEEYSIEVIACHEADDNPDDRSSHGEEKKRCSNRAITTGRTLPKKGADDVHMENITAQNDTDGRIGRIKLKWQDPPAPNGLIVTYEIKYSRVGVTNVQPTTICITHKLYRKFEEGYILPSPDQKSTLDAGNYTFQIRATSLAGNGSWTEPMYFYVPSIYAGRSVKPELIAGVVASVSVLLIFLVAMLVWFVAKKRFRQNMPSVLDWTSVNPDYMSTGADVYLPDEWEVDRDKITLIRELGQGSFGMVHEGMMHNDNEDDLKVAVKTVNENATARDRIEFLNEASVMKAFNCNHVVKLLGVVSIGQPTLVVMELMAQGDLKNYLRMHRPDEEDNLGRKPPTLKEILQMTGEIADGMAYLAAKKFVHRDLAARNCMVHETQTVKIGDFGMTRDIYETDYYRKGGKGLLPVRWMAPESLADGVFTSQSDVWSFGVVLWEMATLAAQPYQGLSNEQVLQFVKDGGMMDKPEGCPERLYDLMKLCWNYRQKHRPTFCKIVEMLVPDLDPSFRDYAFFFSDDNMSDNHEHEHDHEHESDMDDIDELHQHEADDLRTPLTGTPSRQSLSLSDIDVGTPYRSNLSLNDSGAHVTDRDDCRCIDIEPDKIKMRTNPYVTGSCLRDQSPLRGSPIHHPSEREHMRDSSFIGPPPGHQSGSSNEGSKESSKSSGSSSIFHMNGFANGHIPRANNMPPQQNTEC